MIGGRGTRRRLSDLPDRVAMLSLHTSPLSQPGTGDAGGMNVYVWEVSRRLAAAGVAVEVFTRATDSSQPATEQIADRLTVRHVVAGPFQGLRKEDLPGQLCALSAGVLRAEASRPEGWFDLLHSHYWLSGQVGWVAKERWDVPLVHSMHTLAKVKNRDRGAHDAPEPASRVIGEQQVVEVADALIANTEAEAADLHSLYDAPADRVAVVHPGVDLEVFTAGDAHAARRHLGLDPVAPLLVFVGRLQPLKAPDLLLAAAARMPPAADGAAPHVVICGGPSGNGSDMPERLRAQAAALGLADRTTFLPPLARPDLVDLYRAATLVAVPSYSESFGLVAAEAQACGTPVVAAAVGGLRTVVADGISGLLVDGHHGDDWAAALSRVIASPQVRHRLAAGARGQAERFGWEATTAETLRTYAEVLARHRHSAADAQRRWA
ncbi:MAG: D-inositol-3-phosphate glycosyltransferase [Actinomycetota bacterium]|nr:D-inositol-3-phosphate glycosyltransferase [Actinomycetota bacterium]